MKKSIDDFVKPMQEKESESPPSQKPGNEKPKHLRHILKILENRIGKNDFRFLKTIRLEKNRPDLPGTTGELTYAPTEKPW